MPTGGTPDCKVHRWPEELAKLRKIVLDCGLTEELKWGIPCYTYNKSNVATVSAFNEYCSISFFKGALLKDAHRILEKPGKNTQAARLVRFTNVQEIDKLETVLKDYIFEAIEVEKTGLKVDFKKNPEPIPEELQDKFDEIPALKNAFDALTPGRQRAYILYFSAVIQRFIDGNNSNEIKLNLEVGQIPVMFNGQEGWMLQNQPIFKNTIDVETISKVLQIDIRDINVELPVQVVSTGLPSIIVNLKTLDAVNRCKINHKLYDELLEEIGDANLLIFTKETVNPSNDLHVRVFMFTSGH